MEFTEWRNRAAEKTEEKVLKTVDHIIEESNGHLDSEELDDLKDCWKILCMAREHHHPMYEQRTTGAMPPMK